jgi:precorrin isomerase
MTLPEIEKVELEHPQLVADKLRECAGLVAQGMPEIASALTIGADQIESLCDALKAQETLIIDLRQGLIDLGGEG